MFQPIVVIPARMASTRLPGKPLAAIAGRPMILHVLERAMAASLGPVAVACCEAEVFDAVNGAGGFAIMTDPALPSGSDRVEAAMQEIDPRGRLHDVVINLQGDLPGIAPEDLRAVLDPLERPEIDLATLVAPIQDEQEAAAPSVVKAVCGFAPGASVGRALYFSRAAVPWGPGPLWHHVGVYAWRRPALARFIALPPSPLEQRESLEQLRALEAGMAIGCALIAAAPWGVDTPADLARARGGTGMTGVIAFQGLPGAYSDLACRTAHPNAATLPCDSFEAAIAEVREGRAGLAMLPCENSLAGRVPDLHRLLPGSGLAIVGEHFQRVEHCLLGPPGTTIGQVRRLHSHAVALGQVRDILHELGAQAVTEADTAGAAQQVAAWNRPEDAAVASALAAEIYGLEILRANIEDADHNTTRFYIMAAAPSAPPPDTPGLMTTFVFAVRNVPAALYKALGGFATNGVNMTRLESYMVGGEFSATQFLCDVEGHPAQPGLAHAMEELAFFSRAVTVLGTYRQARGRGEP